MEQHQIILAVIAILAWSGFLLGHSHFSKYVSNPLSSEDPRSRRLNGVASYIDPKSITPRPPDGLVGPDFVVQDEALQLSDSPIAVNDNLGLLKSLKETEEIWARGDYIYVPIKRTGKFAAVSNTWGREGEVAVAAAAAEEFKLASAGLAMPFSVCDRAADVPILQNHNDECPEFTQTKPLLILEGLGARGRTGNNLVELLHAFQYARDNDVQLGIMVKSWAMHLIQDMWMANEAQNSPVADWQAQFEQVMCMKVFQTEEELEGWNLIHKTTVYLFQYVSEVPLGQYMATQLDILRTLFTHYNTGEGYNQQGRQSNDMCSGINTIFGMEPRQSVIYSVIHSRYLEGQGARILKGLWKRSGCDTNGALEMHPDYIKSILGPLGMLQHPIVVITDGESPMVIERLMADPDIGGLIHLIPNEASWLGGDITLATMSNVFIGNPASTFSTFIAKSRLALGFGHNYLFRATDEGGLWRTVCGDHCVLDTGIMKVVA
mmetsp:Transcript_127/g.242  ORF Transcript_127/g.242 Transcript_127/m.242 type:complete len:491 (-) Transcript_127:293-1765(-)